MCFCVLCVYGCGALWRCGAVWHCVALCGTEWHCVTPCFRRAAAVSASCTAAVSTHRISRSVGVAVARHVELLVRFRRAAALGRCTGVVVCRLHTRLCLGLGCQAPSCCRSAGVPLRHCARYLQQLCCRIGHLDAHVWHRCRRAVTRAAVTVSLACRVGWVTLSAVCGLSDCVIS